MGALALGLPLTASRADAQQIKIAGSEIATQLQTALGTTTVHLHNLGPLKSGSYHLANASSIKLPVSVTGTPGLRTYFSLPDTSSTLLGRRYGYYADHIRSTGLFVTAGADAFTISITLAAAAGPAFVGNCVRLKAPLVPCAILGENLLPGVAWNDARIDIVAKPIVYKRSLALDVQTVTIAGAFDVGMACQWPLIGARLCATINRQSLQLRQRVSEQVKTLLNMPETRVAVAAAVRSYLDTTLEAPLLGVRRISMQDGQLVIGVALGR